MSNFFNTAQARILIAFLFLTTMLAMVSYAAVNFQKVKYLNPNPATITLSGEGEVVAVPDIGRFSFSVTAEAMEASEAQEISGLRINEILSYLREQGVEDKDIKNQSYNLNPKYRWENDVCPQGKICAGKQVQDGFTVTQSIEVKVRDLDKATALVSGVGEHGATNISGLDFTIDDDEAVRAKARAKAIADAQEKAVVLAKDLGVRLVRIVSYHENENTPYYARAMMMEADVVTAGYGGAELPVGEESVKVQVGVTYEIQ